jgi:hypothetical protein
VLGKTTHLPSLDVYTDLAAEIPLQWSRLLAEWCWDPYPLLRRDKEVDMKKLLLYDKGAREADVVGFDQNGAVNLDRTNTGWRRSWATITPF